MTRPLPERIARVLLRSEGWVNAKRVYRLYREMGLARPIFFTVVPTELGVVLIAESSFFSRARLKKVGL